MYKLFHMLFGAYTISVPAEYGVRLINLLNRKKILFWGAKRKTDILVVKASLFSCEAVIRAAAEDSMPTQIIKTTGIPFVFAKYKGRYGLILGCIAGLFFIFYAQLFVWEVTVSGNVNINDHVIITALESYGVKRGAFIPELDVLKVEERFLMENHDISSISINIKGTYARIDLLERAHPPDITDTTGYCNIVAMHDGIIVRVEASDGSPEVMAGDVVVEGQLLISAFMPSRLGSYRLAHARGEVYAEVKEKYYIEIPLEQTEKKYTGKTQKIQSTLVMGRPVDLFWKEQPSFEYYDIHVSQKEAKLFGVIKTPVVVTTARYTEYKINRYTISEEAAKDRAEQSFRQYIERIEDEIVSFESDGSFDNEKNAYILNASVKVIKNIAVEKPISLFE